MAGKFQGQSAEKDGITPSRHESMPLSGTPVSVLITGGCGFLGVHIARHVYLHWKNALEIRLVDTSPATEAILQYITSNGGVRDGSRVSFCYGDVCELDSLRQAFGGKVDIVFHCAGLVETGSVINRKSMYRVNVDGTRNVVECCSDSGARCLVYPGSVAQVLTTKAKHKINEDMAVSRNEELIFPFYGLTASKAEDIVIHANGRRSTTTGTTLYTCSLRSPFYYGENDTTFVPSACIIAKSCLGFFPGKADSATLISTMYVGNAAWAHLRAAEALLDDHLRTKVAGEVFYIGDETPAANITNVYKEFLKPLGYRMAPIRIPLIFLLILAYIFEFVAVCLAWFKFDLVTSLNRSTVKLISTSHSFSWRKARDDMKYKPHYSYAASLANSMQYYRPLWGRGR